MYSLEKTDKNKNEILVLSQDFKVLSTTDLFSAKKIIKRSKAVWLEYSKSIIIFSLNRDFKEFKRKIIEEEKHICYICGEKTLSENLTVDHLIPIVQNGRDTRDNLRCCCTKCNVNKNKMNVYQYIKFLNDLNTKESKKKVKNIKKSIKGMKIKYEICTSS